MPDQSRHEWNVSRWNVGDWPAWLLVFAIGAVFAASIAVLLVVMNYTNWLGALTG